MPVHFTRRASRAPGGTEATVRRAPGARRPFRHPARWASLAAACVPVLLIFPGLDLSYVAWFGLVPAIALFVRADSTREALARGWWFGAGYLISMLSWMAPEVGPGLVLIGLVAGITWSPFAVFARLLLRSGDRAWQRFALALIALPAAWLIPEWFRSYQGLGGPWDLYGASQWQHPSVLALAAVGGIWLVSVALVMANVGITMLLAELVPGLLTPGARLAPQARASGLAAGGLAALIVAAGAGPLAFALTPPFPAVDAITVALVQPGTVASAAQRVDASETLTASLSKGGSLGGVKPDLIIWGESSIAEDLTRPSNAPLLHQIEALSARDGAEIVVSQDARPSGEAHEKWAVVVSPDGIKGIYVKTRLVPFGEYIPFRRQLSWLTKISNAASSNMVSGTGAHMLMMTDRNGRPLPVGVLICFESAFPDMSRVDADNGAQLIAYQSSTPTFQGTWGPDQHASLAAIRAAETGRPVVQAALTGDTVAFDARGRELAWLGQSGHALVTVRLELPAGSARTFYDQAGDYVMWTGVAVSAIFALVMIAGPIAARRRGFLANTTGADGGGAAEYGTDAGQPVGQ
ncbi:MAG TPA: apolipoprotein N-acyltransferase [Trebonia sp.]|nr:apolipoprotein N-acyltransferase [Trebonia sp.]